jgi:cell division septal protein FtsQ
MAERKNWFRRPGVRVSLIISALMLTLALALLLFWLTTRSLFSRNDHFVLQRVNLIGGEWWQGKESHLGAVLGLVPGKTNLFALDLATIRKTIQEQPSIRSAAVARRLPDTLDITVVERIPWASLYNGASPWVIDEDGVVIARHQCINLGNDMPIITGFRAETDIQSGVELPELQLALDLLRLSRIRHPWMQVKRISLHHPNAIQVSFLVGNDTREFTAVLPRERLEQHMDRLKLAVTQAVRDRDPRRDIDLRFENQIILR